MNNSEIAKILLRRDTTNNWASANPILDVGEPALELDQYGNTISLKFGNGTTHWSDIEPYGNGEGGGQEKSVVEGYYNESDNRFYQDAEYTVELPTRSATIYIDIATDYLYRWNGESFEALTSGGGAPAVPQTERISFAYNLVINSNGAQFGGTNSGYQWNDLNEWGVYPGYDVKGLCYRDEIVQDEEVFKQYMKFMTGSEYLPEYNRNEPHDTYIYLQSGNYDVNSKVWKLQYSHVEFQGQQFNVLLAFRVTQFPFALKEEIPTIPEFPVTYEGSGNLDTSINRIIYTISSDLLSQAKAITFRLVFRDNNKNEGGILLDGVIINHNDVYFAEEHKQGIAENTSLSYYFDTSLPAYTINVDFDINEFDINNLEVNYWTITLY